LLAPAPRAACAAPRAMFLWCLGFSSGSCAARSIVVVVPVFVL
ncbi:hypothetical protein A2U01_0066067, partial [Trifolium medium]|nr:hypothetical protein [Trifolium medium]